MIENNYDELREERLSGVKIFDGVILHVRKDEVRLPNGATSGREYIQHVGAVAVVPLLPDGRVIVEKQFRYPIGSVVTEIPAGKLDSKQEDRLEAAKRELREETGYTADRWTVLGDYYPASAYTDERLTLYLAEDMKKGEQELDEDEFLSVEAIPLDALVEDILSGKITDGKTQVAVLKTAMLKRK